ncbi:MAG TPA: hypothetical protein VMP68_08905 [Candidatus Eisenbacteria bacterium]|nr:hypothetical protein [Candidatus Eisenbacteria bacterium]
MQGLGNAFDFTPVIPLVSDLAAGANTGKRIHLMNYQTVDFVILLNPHSAGTDSVAIALKEHTAASSGTSTALAAIGDVYYKSTASALAGTEAWSFLDNRSGGVKQNTLTLANTGIVPAANQAIVVFSVEADSLDAGYAWVSVDIADPGSGGTIVGGVMAVLTGLKTQRAPDALAQPNA